MPQVALAAAIAGSSAYFVSGTTLLAALGNAAIAGGLSFVASALTGTPSTSPGGSTVPPLDHALGFAPYPQYPNSEMPVPTVFGVARLNGAVVHQRVYGGNFEKSHYLAVFSEVGSTLEQLFIDKYRIEDLPNYYTRTGSLQNEFASWFNYYPNGGAVTLTLNNSGTNNVGLYGNTAGNLSSSQPVLLYGGGTVTLYSVHAWPTGGSTQSWKWRLQNIDDPGNIIETALITETFIQSQDVDGGCFGGGDTVYVPGSSLRSALLTIPDPLSRWSATLICSAISNGTAGGQIGFYKFDIVDATYNEVERINAAFAHVHLVRDDAITSDNPVINARLRTNVLSGNEGNPADALYAYLTDPVKGLGIPTSRVDYGSVLEAIYWCEQNGLTFNRGYGTFYNADQALKEFTAAGRLILTIQNGIIRMKPEKPEPVSYMVHDTEILPGTLRMGIHSARRPNRIEGQYVEPFYGHAIERVIAEDIESINQMGLNTQTVDLTGVTNQTQAFHLVDLMLKQVQMCPYWCEFQTGIEVARLLDIGAVIAFEGTRNSIVNGNKWRIMQIEETEPHVYSFTCNQYQDAVYDQRPFSPWYYQIPEFENINGWPGSQTGAAPVINLQILALEYPANGGLSTNVTVTFVEPPERFDYARIEYTHDGVEWIAVGTTTNAPFTFNWPMRWGMLTVRVTSFYNNANNAAAAPLAGQYVTGRSDETDYPGWARGQWGNAPWALG
jgi:hypothetical protein